MLENLIIKNIVLIDEANIDFKGGLCVLTGETGSGKSILLDALSLAIGVRSSSRLLRNGEKQGSVVATFNIGNNSACKKLLQEQGIECDNELVLKRILYEDGRSKAFINDIPVGQVFLNSIGEELVEIHGQHDQRGLLNPSFHRSILDAYGGLKPQKEIVAHIFDKLKETQDKYNELIQQKQSIDSEKDYLAHVLTEIDNMNIKEGEEEELNNRRIMLMNTEKIFDVLDNVKNTIDGSSSIAKAVASSQGYLSKAINLGQNLLEDGVNAFEVIIDDLERVAIEYNEAMSKIDTILENLDFNEDSLNDVEERLFAIRGLARKFNITPAQLMDYRNATEEKLRIAETAIVEMGNLQNELGELKAEYLKEAEKLRAQRKAVASMLKEELLQELTPLKMGNVQFEVEFIPLEENNWSRSGIDGVRFIASTNIGTELDNLSKIASGGELSRFMLALKVVLSRIRSVPTLIFDEIDTGVSGSVADAVGERLKKLGQNLQVLVITHLPQVAAKGNYHLKISKESNATSTRTLVELLDENGRRREIANMVSGDSITEEALRAADKLLNNG